MSEVIEELSEFSVKLAGLLNEAYEEGVSIEHMLLCMKVNERALIDCALKQSQYFDGEADE